MHKLKNLLLQICTRTPPGTPRIVPWYKFVVTSFQKLGHWNWKRLMNYLMQCLRKKCSDCLRQRPANLLVACCRLENSHPQWKGSASSPPPSSTLWMPPFPRPFRKGGGSKHRKSSDGQRHKESFARFLPSGGICQRNISRHFYGRM